MKCPFCGFKVYYSPALKGALRKGAVERPCTKCRRTIVINPDDLKDPIDKRFKSKAKWNWEEDDDVD